MYVHVVACICDLVVVDQVSNLVACSCDLVVVAISSPLVAIQYM